MKWYWWILVVILGLNAIAIAMIGMMMAGDWLSERRRSRRRDRPRGDPS